jgi:protein involved in polysaccharide export with SLBB domain
MVRYFFRAAVLAIGTLVSGCYTDFGPVVVEPDPIAPSRVATRIQAGDRIKMTVYGEENLTNFYDVDPTGRLSLPLIGRVRAAGRTAAEVERDIANRYRSGGYLQEPKVTIEVIEYRPYYVMGEVDKPSEYPYRSGLNVLTAIATAGGLTYRGSRDVVLIQHAGELEWREYAPTAHVLISPGDLIRVPERYF